MLPWRAAPLVQTLSHGGTLAAIVLGNVLVAMVVGLRGATFLARSADPIGCIECLRASVGTDMAVPTGLGGHRGGRRPASLADDHRTVRLAGLFRPGQSSIGALSVHNIRLVVVLAAVIAFQWGLVAIVGYYLSAAMGNWASLRVLGERRWSVLIGVTGGWLICAYLLFQRLLHVDLPRGMLFL